MFCNWPSLINFQHDDDDDDDGDDDDEGPSSIVVCLMLGVDYVGASVSVALWLGGCVVTASAYGDGEVAGLSLTHCAVEYGHGKTIHKHTRASATKQCNLVLTEGLGLGR